MSCYPSPNGFTVLLSDQGLSGNFTELVPVKACKMSTSMNFALHNFFRVDFYYSPSYYTIEYFVHDKRGAT
jgi:hypothetical protein